MKLIVSNAVRGHVALDTVREFEQAILDDAAMLPDSGFGELASGAAYGALKLSRRLGFNVDAYTGLIKLTSPVPRDYFAVLMGPTFRKCLPYFSFPGRKAIYLFDAWPDAHHNIARFVEQFGVDRVFVSSSQAAASLSLRCQRARCWWVPEGLDPTAYRALPSGERDIDVLAMGRRYDAYHAQIVEPLAQGGRQYLYEIVKGQVIFPDRAAFIDGLSRSRISICVPSSVTHPARAGGISTMTVRYLQSMAAKCLIVGKAPAELIDLFGYNPLIEIDEADPSGQLLQLLREYPNYLPLIERNHAALLAGHTWRHRWQQVADLLASS